MISALFETIGGFFNFVFNIFFLLFCKVIYIFMAFEFQMFTFLARFRYLDQQEDIAPIYNRILLLLGIIMLFVTAFNLIKMLLNPDTIMDKQAGVGNIIKRIIVVVLMLGFTPQIFDIMYYVQDNVISSNILGKVITGTTTDAYTFGSGKKGNISYADFGDMLASNVFLAFYETAGSVSSGCSREEVAKLLSDSAQNSLFFRVEACIIENRNLSATDDVSTDANTSVSEDEFCKKVGDDIVCTYSTFTLTCKPDGSCIDGDGHTYNWTDEQKKSILCNVKGHCFYNIGCGMDDIGVRVAYGWNLGEDDFNNYDGSNSHECGYIAEMNATTMIANGIQPNIVDQYVYSATTGDWGGSGGYVQFHGLLAMVVGIILCFLISSYIWAVSIRCAQLMFYQVIAPIPIISYLLPKKDGPFEKWMKQVMYTYIDVFIRLFILFFVAFISSTVLTSNSFSAVGMMQAYGSPFIDKFKVILIIGLFALMKRIPNLIVDMFGKPNAAAIGFGFKNDATNIASGIAVGAAMGALGSSGWGRLTSAITGAARGFNAGISQGNFEQNMDKAKKAIQTSNSRDEQLKIQGYSKFASFEGDTIGEKFDSFFNQGRLGMRMQMASGGLPVGRNLQYLAAAYNNVKKSIDEEDEVKQISSLESQYMSYGGDISRFGEAYTGSDGKTEYRLKDLWGRTLYDTATDKYDSGKLWQNIEDRKSLIRQELIDTCRDGGFVSDLNGNVILDGDGNPRKYKANGGIAASLDRMVQIENHLGSLGFNSFGSDGNGGQKILWNNVNTNRKEAMSKAALNPPPPGSPNFQ